MAFVTSLALAPVLSVGTFAKSWSRETIKKVVAKWCQFMENFRLLFGLLTRCYIAECVPKIFNPTNQFFFLPSIFNQLDYKCQL